MAIFNIKRFPKTAKIVNKKGQLQQVILFMVIIFALGLTIVVGRFIMDSVFTGLQEGGFTTTESNQSIADMQSQFNVFDYSLVALSVALIIGLMITSFLIPTHPIFIVINIIGIFFLVFIGMIMTNIYGEFVSGEGEEYFGATADNYPLSGYLISNLPYFGAIAIFISSIVMYSRGL